MVAAAPSPASAASRSVGISTYTGREGGTSAVRAAPATTAAASSASVTRNACFTTGRNIAA